MKIDITLKNYRCFPESEPVRLPLRKGFTAFVGANNSGKSSLLKFFFEFRNLLQRMHANTTFMQALRGEVQTFNYAGVADIAEVFCNANKGDIEVEFWFADCGHPTEQSKQPFPKQVALTVPRDTNTWLAKLRAADGSWTNLEDGGFDLHDTILHFSGSPRADLAGLSEVSWVFQNTLYVGSFRNAIDVGAKTEYFDIRVGQRFIENWRNYKTGHLKKDNEAAYRLTEDIRRIFDFKSLEINPSPDNLTLQVFVNGKSYKLPELGSGLAQFLVVFAHAAIKRPSYILIDEPELNLHPSLQVDFLTTLASYASEGIIFATHSIGLARATADQIFSFRQIAEGKSQVTPLETTPRLTEFLGELSFSGYKELGFDRVLLVEGPTEVKTIQQFLRLYRKDHQIVLLPLGGSGLINKTSEAELHEIKRITDNVSALIDSERPGPGEPLPPEREQFVENCGNANIACHPLERRATENYFTDSAIKLVMGDKYRALDHFEKLKDAQYGWSKAENWRIAREMAREDIDKTDLGRFLSSV